MISFEQAFSDTEKAAASTIKSATELANLAMKLQKAAKQLQKVAKEGTGVAIQTIPTLVQGFSDAEKTAELTLKSGTDLDGLAKQLRRDATQLQKAAKEGNIRDIKLRTAAIGRAATRLEGVPGSLRQAVANAVQTWPFNEEQEEIYLREKYAAELRDVATRNGLEVFERDGVLISPPSILRILPSNRAISIDNKRALTIRPSHLTSLLQENQEKQKKQRRNQSGPFLEALYAAYWKIGDGQRSRRLVTGTVRSVVPLQELYDFMTLWPGSRLEHDRVEFAGEIYQLEVNGPYHTKNGLRVSFPTSTAARSTRGIFTFVGPNGQIITYYGIQFSGGM